jgi:hypothetical protein
MGGVDPLRRGGNRTEVGLQLADNSFYRKSDTGKG